MPYKCEHILDVLVGQLLSQPNEMDFLKKHAFFCHLAKGHFSGGRKLMFLFLTLSTIAEDQRSLIFIFKATAIINVRTLQIE